ncbi:ATP-binding response regulator [Isoalcanivorax beigongshangi]|uniref:histidine kinase n=1 Tax=Isoalcanivorax beigongshangi TaxID=3238810 RepID=A0ABV4AKU8_9GAMM
MDDVGEHRSPDDSASPWRLHEARLMAENARLKRICDALIQRVENSAIPSTGPYAAFHHAVILTEQVKQRTQALQDVNKRLLFEVEQRRRIEQRLREASKRAEDANLSKSRFLAAISHDLMQPLNAARLFASALLEDPGENLHTSLRHINIALQDLESLITTLTDASKLDAGVVSAEPGPVPLDHLLHALADESRQLALGKGLRFRYVRTKLVVHSDPQLLMRILRNLLSNAIRYTVNGRILLGCRRRGQDVEIWVTDTGIGMHPNDMDELFMEFKRGQTPLHNQERGLGLGLAIVTKICNILGHRLQVHSEPGRGTTMRLRLPRSHQRVLEEPLANGTAARDSLQGLKVWVVDNDEAICLGMQALLRQWGCDVVVADSLHNLRRQVNTSADAVDVLVMDYHFPNDDDGIKLAGFINAGRREPLPVILLTADRSPAVRQLCDENNYLHLPKPVRPMKLKLALQHQVQQRQE